MNSVGKPGGLVNSVVASKGCVYLPEHDDLPRSEDKKFNFERNVDGTYRPPYYFPLLVGGMSKEGDSLDTCYPVRYRSHPAANEDSPECVVRGDGDHDRYIYRSSNGETMD